MRLRGERQTLETTVKRLTRDLSKVRSLFHSLYCDLWKKKKIIYRIEWEKYHYILYRL